MQYHGVWNGCLVMRCRLLHVPNPNPAIAVFGKGCERQEEQLQNSKLRGCRVDHERDSGRKLTKEETNWGGNWLRLEATFPAVGPTLAAPIPVLLTAMKSNVNKNTNTVTYQQRWTGSLHHKKGILPMKHGTFLLSSDEELLTRNVTF